MEEDAQPLEVPIIAPVKDKKHERWGGWLVWGRLSPFVLDWGVFWGVCGGRGGRVRRMSPAQPTDNNPKAKPRP